MKILVCGDRNWTDKEKIEDAIDEARDGWHTYHITLIEGDCRGADKLAGEIARYSRGIDLEVFPADWDKHGKKAGPIRNRQMLDQEPDLVLAFHNNLSKSKGTLDTVMEANRRGIEVRIISYKANDHNSPSTGALPKKRV